MLAKGYVEFQLALQFSRRPAGEWRVPTRSVSLHCDGVAIKHGSPQKAKGRPSGLRIVGLMMHANDRSGPFRGSGPIPRKRMGILTHGAPIAYPSEGSMRSPRPSPSFRWFLEASEERLELMRGDAHSPLAH